MLRERWLLWKAGLYDLEVVSPQGCYFRTGGLAYNIMLTILLKHFSFLTAAFRYFHEIQSGPGVDKLLYLLTIPLNSSLGKSIQIIVDFDGISFKTSEFIH